MNTNLLIKRCLARVLVLFLCLITAGPAYAVLEVGEEVPNYVRADITGIDLHGEDLSRSSIAGAVARFTEIAVKLKGATAKTKP